MQINKEMYCLELHSEEDWACLEHVWRQFFETCSYPSPFAMWEWARTWWRMLGRRPLDGAVSCLYVLAVFNTDNALVGLVPFHYPRKTGSVLAPRCLRPLGVLGLRYQDLTEEPIILLHRDQEQAVLEAVMTHLKRCAGQLHWDAYQLHVVHPVRETLAAAAPKSPHHPVVQRYDETPMLLLPLPKTWEEYRSSLGQSTREGISRKPRLLSRRCREWSVSVAREPEEVSEATDVLVYLHRKRADLGSPDRTDHLPSKAHRLFLKEVLPALASRGVASVMFLKADDCVIAAQVLLESHGVLLFLYSGFDPEWSNCSPLTILAVEAIKSAILRGVSTLNFHRFVQDWKTRLGARPVLWFEQVVCVRGALLSILRTAFYARDRQCRDAAEVGPPNGAYATPTIGARPPQAEPPGAMHEDCLRPFPHDYNGQHQTT